MVLFGSVAVLLGLLFARFALVDVIGVSYWSIMCLSVVELFCWFDLFCFSAV